MKSLIKNKRLNILDSYLYERAVRIKVQKICNLEKIENQYFVREKSLRKIYYYCKEIGIKNTFLKILSRSREKIRNEKYLSIGIGEVIQSRTLLFYPNQIIYFIATNHPASPAHIVVHEKHAFLSRNTDDFKVYQYNKNFFLDLLGWSPYSGLLPPDLSIAQQVVIRNIIDSIVNNQNNTALINRTGNISEIKISTIKTLSKKTAALFGYGNYAKTIIIPNLNKKIALTKIHEIDPAQLIPMKNNIDYDTSPFPRDANHDIYLIAGYHHTHAEIAIFGLKNNIDVVVEKPLVTTQSDLEKLISAIKESKAAYYACFQRRYHMFNGYVFEDFKLKMGDPISYYAIIYEESMPDLHWYRWPNSKSAIISNGCHWIDHFLFLNNFSPVCNQQVIKSKNSEIIVLVELENRATLSLILSHIGSARIGMQEYIELRSQNNTAKITNGNYYQSENKFKIIRRSKINKYEAYKKMYRMISDNIIDKNAERLSDSWERVQMISGLILVLDQMTVT